MDCGPTCLKIILKYYGKEVNIERLRRLCKTSRHGSSFLSIRQAAESLGFNVLGVDISYNNLKELPLPGIIYWKKNHFVVIYKIKNNKVYISDPANGKLKFNKEEFLKNWTNLNNKLNSDGVFLVLQPNELFNKNVEFIKPSFVNFLISHLKPLKKFYFILFALLTIALVISFLLPLISQSIIDKGIINNNFNLVVLFISAQLILFFSQSISDFLRNWILLHLGSRLNISLIDDFLFKLTKLPLPFFETKMIGDLLQRINDQVRIQNFITSSSFNIIASILTLFVFSTLLFLYNKNIFVIFLLGSILSVFYVVLFLPRRKELENRRFSFFSESQNKLIQILSGIYDVKLNCLEDQKRNEWKQSQINLFHNNLNLQKTTQYQQSGNNTLNQIKNSIIILFACQAVINDNITIGSFFAISFIIGQLASPIDTLIRAISNIQEAKISLERILEVHEIDDEENINTGVIIDSLDNVPIIISNLSFKYEDILDNNVLNNISIQIEPSKITAITGNSGSGKSTLLKIILKLYNPTQGSVKIGNNLLSLINTKKWRERCGIVMQDSYIFNDTIKNNIVLFSDYFDEQKFEKAIEIANLKKMFESTPLAEETKIGIDGLNVSSGERQRILIARAIYKNPDLFILDEATNNLDAENEHEVLTNLFKFLKGKTVIIVAHRLSTIKSADCVILLDKGQLVNSGSHEFLLSNDQRYYDLIKNQI